MLQLFVSISLDPLQQCRQSLLLSLSKESLLLLNVFLERLLSHLSLLLLHLCTLQLQEFRFFVSLTEHQFASLVLELHQFARVGRLLAGFSAQTFVQLLDLKLMLLLQLFQA